MEGSISDFYDHDPVLVWIEVDVVVREGEDLDDIIQRFYSSDEYPNAWAPSGERGVPAEQFQGIGDGGFALCQEGSCRVDYGGCVGIGCFVMSGMMIFLVFFHLEP